MVKKFSKTEWIVFAGILLLTGSFLLRGGAVPETEYKRSGIQFHTGTGSLPDRVPVQEEGNDFLDDKNCIPDPVYSSSTHPCNETRNFRDGNPRDMYCRQTRQESLLLSFEHPLLEEIRVLCGQDWKKALPIRAGPFPV